jgi:hypothetical protein
VEALVEEVMIFVVCRTSETEPPCDEATLERGYVTHTVSSVYLDSVKDQKYNIRTTNEKDLDGNFIMMYETPLDFWIVRFSTLEELMEWTQQQVEEEVEEVIIRACSGPVFNDWFWLQDLATKVDGHLEIYDGYRE